MYKFLFTSPKVDKTGYIFKVRHSFDDRIRESERLKSIEKNKDNVFIIIETNDSKVFKENIKMKNKWVLPKSMTIAQLLFNLRERLEVDQYKSIFLFANNISIPPTGNTLGEVYNKWKDDDGFLYLTLCSEDSFGN
jgi:GABA(A) receptor-associated protein